MTKEIKTVTILGAGVMGSGIAAQLANAGIKVNLLDIVPPGAKDRNIIVKNALERMLKADISSDPMNAGFMRKSNASLITIGNQEDDFDRAVSEADWIIEVIKEDITLKQNLYARIEKVRKPGSVVSSNTSTLPLEKLTEKSGADMKKHFIITHFFNPPRIMRLLELVRGKDTDKESFEAIRKLGDEKMGKKVIETADTPGFIANRIGIYCMSRAIHAAEDMNMKIEEVDAVLSKPLGMPKTGVFALLDMVGIALVPQITKSFTDNLPATDAFVKETRPAPLLDDMLKDGRWGRNSGKGGFYRMNVLENGSKVKEAIDLKTGQYRMAETPKMASVAAGKNGPRAVFETKDKGGELAWHVMRDTLIYVAGLIPEVTQDISDIDASMREGYDWKWGPFELLDKIGVEWFVDKCKQDGVALPPVLEMMAIEGPSRFYDTINNVPHQATFDFAKNRASMKPVKKEDGILHLSDIKRGKRALLHNQSASLWDIGDGVVCLEFHSKMNTLDPLILKMMNDSVRFVNNSKGKFKAMVIHNEGKDFSSGANLGLAEVFNQVASNKMVKSLGLSGAVNMKFKAFISELVYQGQAAMKVLREAPFPVIGAPNGMALGGGCETLLHCDAIQASAESYIGLVEGGVGLIPGWGGNVRYLERALAKQGQLKGPMPAVKEATMAIMMPQFSVSGSAQDAMDKLWLRPGDGISMNKDRVLADAKAKALAMAPGYKAPKPGTFSLPGAPGMSALRMALDAFYFKGGDPAKGGTSPYDLVVGEALGHVLTGGKDISAKDAEKHLAGANRQTAMTIGALEGSKIGVNPSLKVTEDRLLQIERDAFLSLVERPETRNRIGSMLKNGKPFREPANGKSPAEIRAGFNIVAQERRSPTGKPAEGFDAMRLNWLARTTSIIYRVFPQLAA